MSRFNVELVLESPSLVIEVSNRMMKGRQSIVIYIDVQLKEKISRLLDAFENEVI